jgi:hypothetical protein
MRLGGLLAAAVLLTGPAAAAGGSRLTVVASHLNNPRKVFVGTDGAIYVAEAGRGGRDTCLGHGATATCVGLSGSITRIAHGVQKRVVTGLASLAHRDGTQAEGPADADVRGGAYDVLMMDATVTPRGTNQLGPDGATAGDLVSTPPGKAAPSVLANLAAFEAARNPDHGAGPGARYGNPPIDSDPYGLVRYRTGYAVVDAAANDLLWVRPGGKVTVLGVFPVRREPLPAAARARIGAPAGMTTILSQAVPSSVAVGPDGALYVGELTGVPFRPGTARVWRVVPGKAPTVYASGFTTISDLAFSGKDLLVLELTTKGLFGPRSPGALVRVTPNGTRTMVAGRGLAFPTGLAVAPGGAIYVANNGLSPGTGRLPHGELVRVSAG